MMNSKLITDAQTVGSATIKDVCGRAFLRCSSERRNEVLGWRQCCGEYIPLPVEPFAMGALAKDSVIIC